MGGAGWGVMEGMKPVAGMVVVQFVFAGVNIFYKLAVSDGMDMRVLIAYRYIFASVVLAPLAYCVERFVPPYSSALLSLNVRIKIHQLAYDRIYTCMHYIPILNYQFAWIFFSNKKAPAAQVTVIYVCIDRVYTCTKHLLYASAS
jgi:hypothetical protein